MECLMECHHRFDDEITMLGDGTYLIGPEGFNTEELQIRTPVVIVHEGIKIGTQNAKEWRTGTHLRIAAGAVTSSQGELWTTVERFFTESAEGASGPVQVKMVVRPIEVPESKGSQMLRVGPHNEQWKLELGEARVFLATILN